MTCQHWEVWSDERTTYSQHEPPEPWRAWAMVVAFTAVDAKKYAIRHTKEFAEWMREARRDGVNPFVGVHAARPICEHGVCWACGTDDTNCPECLAE